MADPWLQDACSLVDAMRAGSISSSEALEACIEAIAGSSLNAFSHLDLDSARESAAKADVSLPFGGLPMGIKELDPVAGWPYTEGSLVFADRIGEEDATIVTRLRAAGAVLVGQTTSSEFGGINCTRTKAHGVTRNPWNEERTPGGSSGGSAAAVSGGLIPLATGSDGGGSIRIPAAFCGLLGLKPTFGRVPRGPKISIEPLTSVYGAMARSVRDSARYLDVTNGHHATDPYSLPRVEGFEAGLGSTQLAGLRVAVVPDLGAAYIGEHSRALVEEAADALIAESGMIRVVLDLKLPVGGLEWALAGTSSLMVDLADRYPSCIEELTDEIQLATSMATSMFDLRTAMRIESFRRDSIALFAKAWEDVDLIISATNPDVAFAAEGPMSTTVEGVDLIEAIGFNAALSNNGALTIPANTVGNPSISIPVGMHDGLPVGMQVMAGHHQEATLLDVALQVERSRPWPLVAP
ncbi:MAG: amidase [Actinobacteria bacterium]|nr:amidase [Actinomycetota bacterium]